MNLTLHTSGSAQMGDGMPETVPNVAVDVQLQPPGRDSPEGMVTLTLADSVNATFSLKVRLTSLQASQLGHQLCDLAQDAHHVQQGGEKPVVILPAPPPPDLAR